MSTHAPDPETPPGGSQSAPPPHPPPPPSGDPLERPATRATLQHLFALGLLSADARLAALRIALPPRGWWQWAEKLLMALGAALVLAGVVYFFAFNWAEMTRFDKFGLVELGLVLSTLAAGYFGLQSTAGKTSLLASCVLVGVFLVVFSQTYQTGADAWQLFAAWAALIFPWVLVSSFAGLWILWFVLVNVALALLCAQRDLTDDFELITLLGGFNALGLLARELAARAFPWMRGRWHRLLLLTAALGLLFVPALVTLIDSGTRDPGAVEGFTGYLLTLALVSYYYIKRSPDLLALSLAALTVCMLIIGGAGDVWFDGPEGAFEFLFFGFFVLGVFYGALKLLRTIESTYLAPMARAQAEAAGTGDSAQASSSTGASAPRSAQDSAPDHADQTTDGEQAPPPSLGETLRLLVAQQLVPKTLPEQVRERLAQEESTPAQPWYFQVLAGFGAWLSATFFFSFVGALGIVDGEPATLITLGVICTAAGILLRPRDAQTFQRQFALAVGLTGKILVMGGFGEIYDGIGGWLLGSALVMLVVYPLSKDTADRFVMSASTLALALSWILAEKESWAFTPFMVLQLAIVGAAFTLPHALRSLRPMGYAAALGALLTLIVPLMRLWFEVPGDNLVRILMIGALIAAYAWAAGGVEELRSEPLVVAIIATLVLGGLAPAGLLAAVGLLILGFGLHDRVLASLALVFLPVFLIFFYYNLEVTLFSKAWVLIGSGLVMLAARAFLARRAWAQEVA